MILTNLVECSTNSVMSKTATRNLYICYHSAALVHNIVATKMSIDKTAIIRYSVQYRTRTPSVVALKRDCLNLTGIVVSDRGLSWDTVLR